MTLCYSFVNLKQVVDPLIERSAFFAHNENLLVAYDCLQQDIKETLV